MSHLYCIYPSHRVQSDALQAAAKQSLLKRGFGGTGWSLGWKVCLWARLGDGENALRLIENQLRPINPKALIRVGGRLLSQFTGRPPAVPDRRQLWRDRRHCRNAHWRCPAQMLEWQGHRPGNPGLHHQLRLQKRQAGEVRTAIRLFHFSVGSNPPPLREPTKYGYVTLSKKSTRWVLFCFIQLYLFVRTIGRLRRRSLIPHRRFRRRSLVPHRRLLGGLLPIGSGDAPAPGAAPVDSFPAGCRRSRTAHKTENRLP